MTDSPTVSCVRENRLSRAADKQDTFEAVRLGLRPIAIVDADTIFDVYPQDEELTRFLNLGHVPERSQFVMVFRGRSLGAPNVVPGEVYVLPAERG